MTGLTRFKEVQAPGSGGNVVIVLRPCSGRTITYWPSLETDLRNAGTQSVDKSVVADGRVVTSRKPDDLADFCREMLKVFSEAGRRAA